MTGCDEIVVIRSESFEEAVYSISRSLGIDIEWHESLHYGGKYASFEKANFDISVFQNVYEADQKLLFVDYPENAILAHATSPSLSLSQILSFFPSALTDS